MAFSCFQKNLEFLHTDEIIRWLNYADLFLKMEEVLIERSSMVGKVKEKNQECTCVFLSPTIFP